MSDLNQEGPRPVRQPIFLVPGVVTALIGLMWAVHVGAGLVLDSEGLHNLRIWFGFVPFRFTASDLIDGGPLPLLWSGFSHAFLHIDYMHLLLNSAWLAVFGTPVARRYGTVRTLTVFLLGALAGALLLTAHQLANVNQFLVLIGASGGVSALTGAAMRFVFQPLVVREDPETGARVVLGRQTASMRGLMANPRSRAFVLVWLGLNLAIPIAPFLTGIEIPIAWEAHIGGFVAGLLLPGFFDAQARRRAQR